jgi:hypothetical protein
MKKVLFCYLDVLGFKNKLKNKSDDEQVKILNSLFGCISFSIPESLSFQAESNRGVIDLETINTNSILISDSLIVWTNDCEGKSMIEFIYRIQRILRNTFLAGFPLRGTIEYGSIYHEERRIPTQISYNHFELLGGDALMRAYEGEREFQWMGCTISKDCVHHISNIHKLDEQSPLSNGVIIEYAAPKKGAESESFYVINWVDIVVAAWHQRNLIKDLFMQNCLAESFPLVEQKIYNTQKFIQHIVENKLVHQPIGVREKRL